eukprot:COSAG03_NODE_20843_length_312_cov_3.220657_1_plen_40_part_01
MGMVKVLNWLGASALPSVRPAASSSLAYLPTCAISAHTHT